MTDEPGRNGVPGERPRHRRGVRRRLRTASDEDVLRLRRELREAGVETIGEPGAVEPFDPSRHDPLSGTTGEVAAEGAVERSSSVGWRGVGAGGRTVVVRVPGLLYEGRVVRKAGVEAADEEAG